MHIHIQTLQKQILSAFESEVRFSPKFLMGLAIVGLMLFPLTPWAAPPTEEGGKIVFELYALRFEVDPNLAGRVSSVKLEGEEILTVSGGALNTGSTFWPSPQSWGWPPPGALDSKPYTGGIEGDSVVLSSSQDGKTGLIFRKTYRADSTDTCIVIRYTMINGKSSPLSVAPWEVTRLPKTGISFWLNGEGEPTGSLVPMAIDSEGATWLPWQNPKGTHKIFADASGGWLAHVNSKGQFLIKKFKDSPVSQKAPKENEIEFYIGGGYMEMEHQGPYTEIASKDSAHWEVRWYLRKQSDIAAKTGNTELLDFVDAVVNPPVTATAGPWKGFAVRIPATRRLYFQLSGELRHYGKLMNIKGERTGHLPRPLPGRQIQVIHNMGIPMFW